MAAPVYQDVVFDANNPTTSASVTLPATQANDILIMVCVARDNADFNPTPGGTYTPSVWSTAVPGGWSGIGTPGVRCFWSRCTGNHSGQTVTMADASAGSMSLGIVVIRGCITSGSPVDTNSNSRRDTASPDVNTLSSFDTTVTDTLVCLVVLAEDNIAWSSQTKNSVAMNERLEALSSGGSDCMVGLAELSQSSAGATGGFDFTQDLGANDAKRIAAFALKPPAGGTTYEKDNSAAPALSDFDGLGADAVEFAETGRGVA